MFVFAHILVGGGSQLILLYCALNMHAKSCAYKHIHTLDLRADGNTNRCLDGMVRAPPIAIAPAFAYAV